VRAEGRVAFRAVFTPPYHKARLIGLFLAILELVRHGGVALEQTEGDGEIWLVAVG
jgi:segregation and condensation protein A